MKEFKYGRGLVAQNLLWNHSLFQIIVNLSKKVEFSSEKNKATDDGSPSAILRNLSAKNINYSCHCTFIGTGEANQGLQ